ncbi:GGDEF domain-containing protein [Deinococcus sp. 6YEL10]|uniref:GGDEF domain-containing protein n=1 Tax=Deinococcus sp. 6YEL10 TaxID=2745870 RepID=UPI001E4FFB10|nr:GGDEF domain-containing protein [Deinococcus sp. 6YEL10]MCD0160415.1 GGDEF domain-containing protein [Deinococcus sp. 6YEL10]
MSGPPEQRPTLPTPDGTLLPPEELRRRVYLLALAAGLIVLTIVFAVGNFQGRTDVYTGVLVPALTIMVLFSTGWLLAQRSVPFIERAVFICMNVAHLAQILEQTLGPDPNTLASNDAPYWMLVTVCMVAHLIYRPRIAGLYSAAAYLLSCALPLGGLLLTAQPVSAELVRVQLTAGITLVFVHALSWYRGQFEAQRARLHLAQQLAHTDQLTGLPNRRGLYPAVETLLTPGEGGAVLLLDLDHFKRVNDQYGHQAGDTVLIGAATLTSDLLPSPAVVGRWGGEEFMVVLPGTDLLTAQVQAARLCRAFAAHHWPGVGRVTVSIGVSVACHAPNRPPDTLPTLIARADQALYRAKAAGRNSWKADTDPHHPD